MAKITSQVLCRRVSPLSVSWSLYQCGDKEAREKAGDTWVFYRAVNSGVDELLRDYEDSGWDIHACDGSIWSDGGADNCDRWILMVDMWGFKAFSVFWERNRKAWRWFVDNELFDGARVTKSWLWSAIEALLAEGGEIDACVDALEGCWRFMSLAQRTGEMDQLFG